MATEVRFEFESLPPVEGMDRIYDEYRKTFGRYPDEFMAQTVAQVKEDLFMWWGTHRERIREALVLADPGPEARQLLIAEQLERERNAGVAPCEPAREDDSLLIDNLMRAALSANSAAVDEARMALRRRFNELRRNAGVNPSDEDEPQALLRDAKAALEDYNPEWAKTVAGAIEGYLAAGVREGGNA